MTLCVLLLALSALALIGAHWPVSADVEPMSEGWIHRQWLPRVMDTQTQPSWDWDRWIAEQKARHPERFS